MWGRSQGTLVLLALHNRPCGPTPSPRTPTAQRDARQCCHFRSGVRVFVFFWFMFFGRRCGFFQPFQQDDVCLDAFSRRFRGDSSDTRPFSTMYRCCGACVSAISDQLTS